MAKKGSSKHQQEEYKKYQSENRWERNKRRRLARHVMRHPEDKNAVKVLDEGFNYTRNSFKHQKQESQKIKLKQLPVDQRKTLEEQLKELIDSGELELTRR